MMGGDKLCFPVIVAELDRKPQRLAFELLPVLHHVPEIFRRHRRHAVATVSLELGESFRGEPCKSLADRGDASICQGLQVAETKALSGLELPRMHSRTNARIRLVRQCAGNITDRNHQVYSQFFASSARFSKILDG